MKTRSDRCRDLAYALHRLQNEAKRYAADPEHSMRTQDLAGAAEYYVRVVENVRRAGK